MNPAKWRPSKWLLARITVKHQNGNGATVKTVGAHSQPHQKSRKASAACAAADVLAGVGPLRITRSLVALKHGVSTSSVARAQRLTPEQRDAVRRGERPLVLPVIEGPQQRLAAIVDEIGLDRTLNLLNAFEITNAAV
jgi:hypothetical protein